MKNRAHSRPQISEAPHFEATALLLTSTYPTRDSILFKYPSICSFMWHATLDVKDIATLDCLRLEPLARQPATPVPIDNRCGCDNHTGN
ncbi:hypothetical protein VTO58DRAFT_100872 [Aureobasidium pullulans]